MVVLPGLGNATEDYNDFVQELEERDISATVAEVKRIDWLRNAAVRFTDTINSKTLHPII